MGGVWRGFVDICDYRCSTDGCRDTRECWHIRELIIDDYDGYEESHFELQHSIAASGKHRQRYYID
jgi:hypothetical protein